MYYRYYGNAVFECTPPLTRRGLTAVGAKLTNVTFAGGGVQPDAPGKALRGAHLGSVEIDVRLPYVIADTQIAGAATVPDGGAVSFLYSLDGGRSWLLGGEVRQSGQFGPIGLISRERIAIVMGGG